MFELFIIKQTLMFSERWLIYSKHICEGHECSHGQSAVTPSDTPIRGDRVRQVFTCPCTSTIF